METVERTLFLNGTIAEDSWFDDDVTPQMFKEELLDGSGDVTVWINSPGGDCVAAGVSLTSNSLSETFKTVASCTKAATDGSSKPSSQLEMVCLLTESFSPSISCESPCSKR